MSRIYYRGKLYDYPIKPLNALRNLGPVEAVRCGVSYLWAQVRPPKNQDTLEGFVVASFGWRLYQHFFKTYNEKVWGVSASEISADWGAQRIKDLSLFARGVGADPGRSVVGRPRQVEAGHEPHRGVQLPEVRPRHDVGEVHRDGHRPPARKVVFDSHGHEDRARRRPARPRSRRGTPTASATRYECTDVISSMPIGALLEAMDPPVPADVLKAADVAALPRLHDRRARRAARSTRSPTTGSTSTTPTSRSGASRTSARGRRTW